MKKLLMAFGLAALACGPALAEGGNFDAELSALRGDTITMCAQLQAGQPRQSREQLLAEIDAIAAKWEGLREAYAAKPPEKYAADPAWKNYFAEAADNFSIMRAKAAAGEYKRAAQFCGMNCALFVKMHQVNGVSTLCDRLFSIRQGANLALAMAKAGNRPGALETLKKAGAGYKGLEALPAPAGADAKVYGEELASLKKDFLELEEVFAKPELKELDAAFKAFLRKFNVVYAKYI